MKKNICKFMYILGTVFLFLGTIMSTVTSVVTASTVSSSNESRISREVQKSSSSVNVQRSSESKSMSTSKMSSREQTTSKVRSQNEHVAVQNLAAGSSSSSSMGGAAQLLKVKQQRLHRYRLELATIKVLQREARESIIISIRQTETLFIVITGKCMLLIIQMD